MAGLDQEVNETTPNLHVAIYARISSDEQDVCHTIVRQLAELTTRMQQDGYFIQESLLFVDNGYSGDSLSRPALNRLRNVVALATVDIVYIHSPDRLISNCLQLALLIREFADAGTQVVFLEHADRATITDTMRRMLQDIHIHYKRAEMPERDRRGRHYQNKMEFVRDPSGLPYGYRYNTNEAGSGVSHYVVNEEAASIIRQLFTRAAIARVAIDRDLNDPVSFLQSRRSRTFFLR
jgi:site-specific DNA recombinase